MVLLSSHQKYLMIQLTSAQFHFSNPNAMNYSTTNVLGKMNALGRNTWNQTNRAKRRWIGIWKEGEIEFVKYLEYGMLEPTIKDLQSIRWKVNFRARHATRLILIYRGNALMNWLRKTGLFLTSTDFKTEFIPANLLKATLCTLRNNSSQYSFIIPNSVHDWSCLKEIHADHRHDKKYQQTETPKKFSQLQFFVPS